MTTIKGTEARANLYKLLNQAGESHEPIQITGKRSNAVLISEDDRRSIQETLYLLSIPGMRESIRKGPKTPAKKCSEKPGVWPRGRSQVTKEIDLMQNGVIRKKGGNLFD